MPHSTRHEDALNSENKWDVQHKCFRLLADLCISLSNHQTAAARSRSRTNIAQEGEAEASSQELLQDLMPEEVLVISFGNGPQTIPGMMSENEVMWLEIMHWTKVVVMKL